MDKIPFRDAIKACLKMEWAIEMRPTTLDQDNVRQGLYDNVIALLSREIKWIKVP